MQDLCIRQLRTKSLLLLSHRTILRYCEWFGSIDREASNSDLERNFALLSSGLTTLAIHPSAFSRELGCLRADDAPYGKLLWRATRSSTPHGSAIIPPNRERRSQNAVCSDPRPYCTSGRPHAAGRGQFGKALAFKVAGAGHKGAHLYSVWPNFSVQGRWTRGTAGRPNFSMSRTSRSAIHFIRKIIAAEFS